MYESRKVKLTFGIKKLILISDFYCFQKCTLQSKLGKRFFNKD